MRNTVRASEALAIKRNPDGFTIKQLATIYDLTAERVRRMRIGRNSHRYGNAKLCFDTAEEMIRMKEAGIPQRKIARRFGVSDATVSLVVRRKIWVRS